MNVLLTINGKQRKFTFSSGWFLGMNFTLFSLQLFEHNDYWWTIFYFQIAKFEISLVMDEVECNE